MTSWATLRDGAVVVRPSASPNRPGNTMTTITEADLEAAALAWFSALGWGVLRGPDIASHAPRSERGEGPVLIDAILKISHERIALWVPNRERIAVGNG